MKNCSETGKIISLYIDNELNTDERKEFENHVDICPACKKELDEIIQTVNLCRNIEEKELPLNFKQKLHKRLLQLKEQENGRDRFAILRTRYARILSSVAAGLLLIFLMQGLYNSSIFSPRTANNSAESVNMKAKAPEYFVKKQDVDTVTEKSVIERAGTNDNRNIQSSVTVSDYMTKTAENRLITLEITVDDLKTQTEKVKAIATQYGGKEVQKLDENSINFLIPNVQYEDFAGSLKYNYGQSNIQTGTMVSENLTNIMNDYNFTNVTNVTIVLKNNKNVK